MAETTTNSRSNASLLQSRQAWTRAVYRTPTSRELPATKTPSAFRNSISSTEQNVLRQTRKRAVSIQRPLSAAIQPRNASAPRELSFALDVGSHQVKNSRPWSMAYAKRRLFPIRSRIPTTNTQNSSIYPCSPREKSRPSSCKFELQPSAGVGRVRASQSVFACPSKRSRSPSCVMSTRKVLVQKRSTTRLDRSGDSRHLAFT